MSEQHATVSTQTEVALRAEIRKTYEALEQAIAPIDDKITDLRKNWKLRPAAFWEVILTDDLPVVRGASTNSLERGEYRWSVVLLDTKTGYSHSLRGIERWIEEVGIRLTAYGYAYAHRTQSWTDWGEIERHIRARQSVLHALEELSKAVHAAIDNGRIQLTLVQAELAKKQSGSSTCGASCGRDD